LLLLQLTPRRTALFAAMQLVACAHSDLALPKAESELHRFDHERNTLHLKSDFEAAVVIEREGAPVLIAFGSGALPAPERIVLVSAGDPADPAPTPANRTESIDASPLYASLREMPAFSAAPLNLEAAAVQGRWLLLVQRGSGAHSRNAIIGLVLDDFLAWVDANGPVPKARRVHLYDLGERFGVPFGFSGLNSLGDNALVFTASAERTRGPLVNGDIVGSLLGLLRGGEAFWAPILDRKGPPLPIKVEGVVPDPHHPRRYLLTIDPDDSQQPALLCQAELSGAWPSSSAGRTANTVATELPQ
jgi:hypothetical protein